MKKTAETMRATFSRSDRAALAAAIRAAHNLSKFGGANIDGAAHVKQAARVIKAVRVKPATNSAFSAAAIAARQQAADGAPSCHALAMTIGQPDAGMRREALARVEARRAYRQFDLLVMQAAARLSIGAIRRAYNMSGDDKIRRMLSGLRADIAAMLRADDARTFSDGADVLQAVACALLPYVGEDGSLDLSAIVGLTPKGLPLTVAKVGFRAAHAEIYPSAPCMGPSRYKVSRSSSKTKTEILLTPFSSAPPQQKAALCARWKTLNICASF